MTPERKEMILRQLRHDYMDIAHATQSVQYRLYRLEDMLNLVIELLLEPPEKPL